MARPTPVGRAITASGSARASPCRYATGCQAQADEAPPFDDDPLVDAEAVGKATQATARVRISATDPAVADFEGI
jgi:hypothetical protein